jgi:hypothetical protein
MRMTMMKMSVNLKTTMNMNATMMTTMNVKTLMTKIHPLLQLVQRGYI